MAPQAFEFPDVALMTVSQHLYPMNYGLLCLLGVEAQHKLQAPKKFLN